MRELTSVRGQLVGLDLIFPGYQLIRRAGFINPLVCVL